jgi:hypothetical protein
MGITGAILTLGLTLIQPPEKRGRVFVSLLVLDFVFWLIKRFVFQY